MEGQGRVGPLERMETTPFTKGCGHGQRRQTHITEYIPSQCRTPNFQYGGSSGSGLEGAGSSGGQDVARAQPDAPGSATLPRQRSPGSDGSAPEAKKLRMDLAAKKAPLGTGLEVEGKRPESSQGQALGPPSADDADDEAESAPE